MSKLPRDSVIMGFGIAEKIIMKISIKNNFSSRIARESGKAYTHCHLIFIKLEKEGLITRDKRGKKVYIELTDKGIKIRDHLKNIRKLL